MKKDVKNVTAVAIASANFVMKFYTKTGDKGKTSLRMGTRVSKDNVLVEAYGTIDELNSAIGFIKGKAFNIIQSDLMHICALLAGEKKDQKTRVKILEVRVKEIETEIDKIQAQLPKQTQFYLPGGSVKSAQLDLARTICRRAERRLITANISQKNLLQYMNRLSDYLYALARLVNKEAGVEERIWNSKI
ncbi:MAG: cob(I)yrinic acid a,c-diamide adenosyltransferase [bacterium]|nr:cob(I)yrinic acid a,c-diamide adenosyltransferase [bacterium]